MAGAPLELRLSPCPTAQIPTLPQLRVILKDLPGIPAPALEVGSVLSCGELLAQRIAQLRGRWGIIGGRVAGHHVSRVATAVAVSRGDVRLRALAAADSCVPIAAGGLDAPEARR